MAKKSTEDWNYYKERKSVFEQNVENGLNAEKAAIADMAQDPDGDMFKKLDIVEETLNITSNYIIISGISQAMLNTRDELALNEARKVLYRSVIYLEEVVSAMIDAPYSEYEEKVSRIETMDAASRYRLACKMGLTLDLLKRAYGDNTKWKWAFVELEGRYATVAKNIINLRDAVANTDLRSPDYQPTVYHLQLIKKLLMQAADRYREKYELSTNRTDDFRMAIRFLNALRRIHVLMGERDEAETVKKKLAIWTAKLETDIKG